MCDTAPKMPDVPGRPVRLICCQSKRQGVEVVWGKNQIGLGEEGFAHTDMCPYSSTPGGKCSSSRVWRTSKQHPFPRTCPYFVRRDMAPWNPANRIEGASEHSPTHSKFKGHEGINEGQGYHYVDTGEKVDHKNPRPCKHCGRDSKKVFVYTFYGDVGVQREEFKIDACIADIVESLSKNDIITSGCCCGHGIHNGRIGLLDGRSIIVKTNENSTDPKLGGSTALKGHGK